MAKTKFDPIKKDDIAKDVNAPVPTNESEIESLKAKLIEQQQIIEEQGALISEMMEANSKLSAAPASKLPTVEVDGKVYPIKAKRFIVFGIEYTADKLSKNPKLAKSLLDKKSDILGAPLN